MGNQKRQLFVPGPPEFTKSVSFPSAVRVTRFRLPVSGPLNSTSKGAKQPGRGMGMGIAHYEYIASAKMAPALREVMWCCC